MSVVYQPPSGHYCGPNRYGYWLHASFDAPGTGPRVPLRQDLGGLPRQARCRLRGSEVAS